MAEIKSEPKRGLSNYWIELVGMDSLHRSGAAIMHFKISVRDGTKELSSTTIPITVARGDPGRDPGGDVTRTTCLPRELISDLG